MKESVFEIRKMDCPSEENLIRMKLDGLPGLLHLEFDIPHRKLSVFHEGHIDLIESSVMDLNLGGRLLSSQEAAPQDFSEAASQSKLLWSVLSINFAFFVIEMTTGLLSQSMGLIADSLDMLSDSFVYGISLFAVGGSLARKKGIATTAGCFQLILACIGFMEVLRRFWGVERMPDHTLMIGISFLALIANALCLVLLQQSKSKEEAHMKASLIFTSNDVIINIGVIVAGACVLWLQSNLPDLIIGSLVFVLVLQGAVRILKLGK